jgi:putative ABC transport system permease protein
MDIPVTYNLRNLAVRKTTTVMTALGIALTVSVLLAVLALVQGLGTAFESTGDPLEILVLRNGSNSELVSNFTRAGFQDLKFKKGIAMNAKGEPLASLEMVTVLNLATDESANGNNITLRGILPIGLEMRGGLKLDSGRWFQQGRREIVVGKSVASRYPQAAIGQKLHFGRGDWDVVGIMSAGDSTVNSEIWADLNQASSDYNRSEVLSSAHVRAADPVAATALINDIKSDQKLNMDAQFVHDYYEAQMVSAAPVKFLGIFVAVIMAVGSCFAAMNTMYAAVAKRAREIGTLRVLGFSRGRILLSFFIESLLLSVLGGLIGVILVLPLNNITTGIGSFTTFSEIAFNFRVTPVIMLGGIMFALLMGAAGGLAPARNAAKKEILVALRDI